METAKMKSKMFKEGDIVPGVGVADTNHFGLPWPAYMEGDRAGLIYGTVQIKGTSILCDAMSGDVLSVAECLARRDNPEFDYENKCRDVEAWRKTNQPDGPYGLPAVPLPRWRRMLRGVGLNI